LWLCSFENKGIAMKHKPHIYIAADPEDQAIAAVLKAYLDDRGFCCIRREAGREQRDLYGVMQNSDVIVVVDSEAFRLQADNWELQFAQSVTRPLVVVSLHQQVDERRSTARVRLFDFSHPMKRHWRRVLDTIAALASPAVPTAIGEILL
jgi:hypothetical protein